MNIKLLSLHMENFKGFKSKTIQFGQRTKIKGMNGLGKSTIAIAWGWLFFNYSYDLSSNPKVRREVNSLPIEGEVSVTATLTLDGKEVIAKKIQKRKLSKKDGDDSYADENTYFINDVPKTLRDFNEYFGFDMTVFLLCSNVNKFLSQKSKEMREFLFGLVDNITDLDIAKKFAELFGLVELLEKYTLVEITAMNKASKTKLDKELSEIDPRIDQLQKSILDVDFSDEELRLSSLKEQLAEVELKLSDTSKSYEEVNKLKSEIAEVKGKMDEIERVERNKLSLNRNAISGKVNDLNRAITGIWSGMDTTKGNVAVKQKSIERNTELLGQSKRDYASIKSQIATVESEKFDDTSLNCPTCNQLMPEDKQKGIRSNYDVEKQKRIDVLNKKLEGVVEQGNLFNGAIGDSKIDIGEFEDQLKEYETEKTVLEIQLADAKVELEKLPSNILLIDIPELQIFEYELHVLEEKLETAVKSTETIDTLKQSLLDSKVSIQSEIESTQRLLGTADSNNRAETTILELKDNRRQLSQSIADCDRIKDLIETLDRKKNELLVGEINSKFSIVKWVLYEYNKSGMYQAVCIPTIDGYLFGDTTNEGREIAAKIDICQSIQKLKNIGCPIFLDRAESINDFNIPEVDCQMVLLSVSSDAELKVEVQ